MAPEGLGKQPNEKKSLFNIENFVDYSRSHPREVAAYALLVLGIFFLFVFPILGQALIGIVIAIFFSPELFDILFNYSRYIASWGVAHSIVLAGAAIAFFIQAPVIFIAAGFTLGLKHLFEAGGSRNPRG